MTKFHKHSKVPWLLIGKAFCFESPSFNPLSLDNLHRLNKPDVFKRKNNTLTYWDKYVEIHYFLKKYYQLQYTIITLDFSFNNKFKVPLTSFKIVLCKKGCVGNFLLFSFLFECSSNTIRYFQIALRAGGNPASRVGEWKFC